MTENTTKGEFGFVAAKGRCHDEKEEHHHHPDDCSACYEMYGYAFKEGYERGLEETRINLRGLKKDVERGQSPARALDKFEKWLEKEAGKK